MPNNTNATAESSARTLPPREHRPVPPHPSSGLVCLGVDVRKRQVRLALFRRQVMEQHLNTARKRHHWHGELIQADGSRAQCKRKQSSAMLFVLRKTA